MRVTRRLELCGKEANSGIRKTDFSTTGLDVASGTRSGCLRSDNGLHQSCVTTDLARFADWVYTPANLQSNWEIPMRFRFRGNLVLPLGHGQSLRLRTPKSLQIERIS